MERRRKKEEEKEGDGRRRLTQILGKKGAGGRPGDRAMRERQEKGGNPIVLGEGLPSRRVEELQS